MSKLNFIYKNPFVFTIVKMILIVLLLIYGLSYWLGYSTNHGQKIVVPDLSKMSLLKMKVTLEKANLTYKVQDTVSFNPNYPPLTVVEQNPEFGEYVKEHRKIYVKLNPSGYKKVRIPQFYGKTKRQILLHLKSIGLTIGEFSYIPDKGKDVVRGLSFKGKKLAEGDKIPKKSKIDLVLGKGYVAKVIDTLSVSEE